MNQRTMGDLLRSGCRDEPTVSSLARSTSVASMEVDEKTWESEVIRRSGETPVIVDFWAEWCKPCKALTPVLEEAVEERDVVLATVDVEANKNLAREYGIASIPAV